MATSVRSATTAPTLRRALGLWDLILYGMIVIQPTAPMPVYGVMSQRSHGHAVTTVLIAMFAMLFTAISYGRMARAYPSAGSAFTYVGQEIHPALGYVTGWGMTMAEIRFVGEHPLTCRKGRCQPMRGLPARTGANEGAATLRGRHRLNLPSPSGDVCLNTSRYCFPLPKQRPCSV